MEKVNVIEFQDMPPEHKEALKEYYNGTDHRDIQNGSFARYPYLSDLDDDEWGYEFNALDKWFISKCGEIPSYVIIEFDW